MNNKKVLIKIIIGVISIIIISVILWCVLIKKNETHKNILTNNWYDTEDLVLSADLYPVINNDKWGYIDTSGKMVIESKYDYAYYFYGDIGEVEINGEKKLIDKRGNIIDNGTENIYDDYYGSSIVNGNLYYQTTKKLNNDNIYVYPFENDIQIDDYLEDTGLFGFFDTSKNITGVINRKGKIIYKTKSSKRLELIYDDISSENYNNFASRYCTITVGNKSGVINCDSGTEIYPLTEKYTYDLVGCNFIDIHEGTKYLRTEYIYQDKVVKTFKEKITSVNNQDTNNYISMVDKDENYIKMLLDGTIIKSDNDEKLLEYNYYRQSNYLLGNTFEIVVDHKENVTETSYESFDKYGIKKNNKLILPTEYDHFYFDLDNDKYIIGTKENDETSTCYLYDLDNPSSPLFASTEMGFLHKNYIYYYSENNQIIYNLDTKQKLSVEKDARIYAYDNFIEVKFNHDRKIYDKDFKMIYEYTR